MTACSPGVPVVFVLAIALSFHVCLAAGQTAGSQGAASQPVLTLEAVKAAYRGANFTSAPAPDDKLQVVCEWQGNLCKPTLTNAGPRPVGVR